MVVERVRKLWDAETLLNKVASGVVKLPPFQRGAVWNRTKKSEAIYSLLTIGLPDLVFLEDGEGYQLLDGLQRLTALKEFVEGEFEIKLDPKIEHFDRALAEELEGKRFDGLSEELKRRILNADLGAVVYRGVDSFDLAKEIFTRINYRPTPLSQPELLFVLTYDDEKSELLKTLGDGISKRRLKGFGLLARLLADYLIAREILSRGEVDEEFFRFSTYYDWLYRWLRKAFETFSVEEIEEIAEGGLEAIEELKGEGIDAVKKPYWIEAIAFALAGGLSATDLAKRLSQSAEWRENTAQRNRQKPKVLKERFEILLKSLPRGEAAAF